MKIAHVTATFPPYWGGTGNVAYYNALELAKRGHEVHVFTASLGTLINEEILEGYHVHRLKPNFRYGNGVLLPGLLSLRNFDIIHFHYPFFGGEFTAVAANMRKIPLIITYHQDVHLQGLLKYVEGFLRITLSRWILNSADKVLFTSQDYSRASYARAILYGREDHIGELANGVDPIHFCSGDVDPSFVNKYKTGRDDKIVLLVARLDRAHYFKGIAVFLQAISKLTSAIKAIIVGEGDMKAEYMNMARMLNIQDRVFFTGQVTAEELPEYYRLADVTVLPSTTMGEAFGLVLVESLACGTPVIASNIPGVRTVVSNEVDGYLVNPGDVIDLCEKLKLVSSLSPRQLAEMGAAGRRKVEQNYTWELAGQRLEQIYQEVIEQHVG